MPVESGDRIPVPVRLLSLREDVLIESDPDTDALVVLTRWREIRIDDPDPSVHDALRRMSLGPVSLDNLGADDELVRLHRILDLLGGSVVHSLGLDDGAGPLLSAVPMAPAATLRLRTVDPGRPIRLSRFAAIRTGHDELLVESALARHQVLLHRRLASYVLASLGAATTISHLASALDAAQPVIADVVAYLVAAGVILVGEWRDTERRGGATRRGARFSEEDDPDLIPWSHHDLLFHAHSRSGRHGGSPGADFAFTDQLTAPPAVKPVPAGQRFELPRPVLSEVAAADPPLTDVIEHGGRSAETDTTHLSTAQLGELLFRVARVRSIARASIGDEIRYEISDRPYPSLAGLYELELYVSVPNNANLPHGIYHYDPLGHALTLINTSEDDLADLLDSAKVAAATTRRPAVLITICVRLARLTWMYSEVAYSTCLMHVGALQEVLQLVASAMGFPSCAITTGGSAATDSALGLSWPAEAAVGEFVIGSPPPVNPFGSYAR